MKSFPFSRLQFLSTYLGHLAPPIRWILVPLIVLLFPFDDSLNGQTKSEDNPREIAWQKHQRLAEQSPFKALTWNRLGPKFAGGRIESIDAPIGDLGTIYVGVGAGGIWKTKNGGLTWKPIFEQQSTYAIGDLTIAPSNPEVIWVGTGECHPSSTSYAGTGIYRSIDAGKTWTNIGLRETAHVGRIVVHPNDPDTAWIAAMGKMIGGGQRGVYKTTDGGNSFERVLFENEHVSAVDLVMDPENPDRLFAAMWDRRPSGNKSGLFASDDGGTTWNRLSDGLPEGKIGRIAVDVAPSNPKVVYALMADRSTPKLAKRQNASILFRSDDRGKTWRKTHQRDYVPTYIGWDFCDLRVAADDEDHIYIGGQKLISSSNGGKTFDGDGSMRINRKKDHVHRLHPHRGIGLHLDVHDIWIDQENPERILLGNDGGLFVSWDRGNTWLHLNNLPIAEFYKIHLDDQNPFQIWGGTQDNASFVGSSTARSRPGEDDLWQHVFLDPWSGGDGFSTFPDPHQPEITYYTQQNGDMKRSRMGRLRPERSVRPRASANQSELRFAWDAPFFASVHGQETTLYCAAQRIFRSEDRGDTWKAISPDLTRGGLDVLVESPLDKNRLIAGGRRGKLFATTDGGENWNTCEGLPKKRIRDIAASPHNKNRLFAVLSGEQSYDRSSYVFASSDFGKTWRSITANLPAEPANAICEDAATDGLLFVGTSLGVYASTNHGQSWFSLSATLPTAPVVDLAVQPQAGTLVAATHGLGVFSIDIHPVREAATKSRD